MAEMFLETIKVLANGQKIAEVNKYADDMSAAIFYHAAFNSNLRLIQSGELKSFYANIHNESGVVKMQERWEKEEPVQEPDPNQGGDPTP